MNMNLAVNLFNAVKDSLKNAQSTQSTTAGVITSSLVVAIGGVLVSFGVALPLIGGLTYAEVAAAGWVIGQAVPIFVSDKVQDHIVGLSQKAVKFFGRIPTATPEFPSDKNGQFPQAQAAVAVINAHVEKVQNDEDFPQQVKTGG